LGELHRIGYLGAHRMLGGRSTSSHEEEERLYSAALKSLKNYSSISRGRVFYSAGKSSQSIPEMCQGGLLLKKGEKQRGTPRESVLVVKQKEKKRRMDEERLREFNAILLFEGRGKGN